MVIYLTPRTAASPACARANNTPLQLHADVHNHLQTARFHLEHDNTAGARRKLVQALAALRALDQVQEVQP